MNWGSFAIGAVAGVLFVVIGSLCIAWAERREELREMYRRDI